MLSEGDLGITLRPAGQTARGGPLFSAWECLGLGLGLGSFELSHTSSFLSFPKKSPQQTALLAWVGLVVFLFCTIL